MTLIQAEVIKKLAKNNMNTTATAKEMFIHRNSIYHHIGMIRRDTGLNPLNFYDLCTLLRKASAVLEGEHDND
jgi:sugar diacid utilization regulator